LENEFEVKAGKKVAARGNEFRSEVFCDKIEFLENETLETVEKFATFEILEILANLVDNNNNNEVVENLESIFDIVDQMKT
jgi:hypothetical protein